MYTAVHILWNILDLAALHFFMRRLYGAPVHRVLYWTLLAFFAFGTPAFVSSGNGFYNILFMPVCSLFLLPCFKGGRLRQLLFGACLIAIATTLDLLAVELSLLLSPHGAVPMWAVNLCMRIALWLLLFLITRLAGPEPGAQVPMTLWAALLAIPIASLCLISMNVETACLIQNSHLNRQSLACAQIALSSAVLLFMNLLVFYIYDRVSRLRESAENNLLLEQQIAEQTRHYEELWQTQNAIRSLHHDMKNQLSLLSYLLQEGRQAQAEALLSSLEASVRDVSPVVATGNEPLDAMLDIKLAELREADVSIKLDIAIPQGLPLRFAQAATIFGNLLDNVREACLRLPKKQREMSLKLAFLNDMLYLTLHNSCVAEGDGQTTLQTRKPDKLLHGIGLRNVDRYVRELGGTMEYGRAGSIFTVKIVLYHMQPIRPQDTKPLIPEQAGPTAQSGCGKG